MTVCRRVLPTRKTVSAAKKKCHFKKGKKGRFLQLFQRKSDYLSNSFHMGVSHVIQTIHLHSKVLKFWIIGSYPLAGFHQLWNPAIYYWWTWKRWKASTRWLKTLYSRLKTLYLSARWLKTFYGIYGDGWKILQYSIGEHDPGWAQDCSIPHIRHNRRWCTFFKLVYCSALKTRNFGLF